MSVGIGGSQKVDLRSPRPALICVPRGSGIAFHRAGTGERARGRAHVYNAGRAGIAGPPKRNLLRMIRTNYEFRRLAERYDEVNRNIYRIESGEEPTTDEVLARLKKWRLKFKDEIAAILTKLEHRM